MIHFSKVNGDHLPFTRVVLSQWGDDDLDCIGRVWKNSIELEERGISLSLRCLSSGIKDKSNRLILEN